MTYFQRVYTSILTTQIVSDHFPITCSIFLPDRDTSTQRAHTTDDNLTEHISFHWNDQSKDTFFGRSVIYALYSMYELLYTIYLIKTGVYIRENNITTDRDNV